VWIWFKGLRFILATDLFLQLWSSSWSLHGAINIDVEDGGRLEWKFKTIFQRFIKQRWKMSIRRPHQTLAWLYYGSWNGQFGPQSFCRSTPMFYVRVVSRQNRRLAGFRWKQIIQMTLKTNRKRFKCLTIRYNALLSAFSVILAGVFISRDLWVIIKGAIVQPHAPRKVARMTTRVHWTYRNPEPPANILILP